jgi:2-polyprenyl-6-methoxyphenol hydroxylase-like FAD-dependent oxidoreductase
VWLAGDAAHVHSPVGGRGMNMGIADGVRFAQAVKDGDFSAYEKDRHTVAEAWVKKNRVFTEVMSDQAIKGMMGRLCVRTAFRMLSMVDPKHAAQRVFSAIALG